MGNLNILGTVNLVREGPIRIDSYVARMYDRAIQCNYLMMRHSNGGADDIVKAQRHFLTAIDTYAQGDTTSSARHMIEGHYSIAKGIMKDAFEEVRLELQDMRQRLRTKKTCKGNS